MNSNESFKLTKKEIEILSRYGEPERSRLIEELKELDQKYKARLKVYEELKEIKFKILKEDMLVLLFLSLFIGLSSGIVFIIILLLKKWVTG